jgi:Zn finger protein HypA/HybF involved in hydrogenase expression
MTRIYNYCTKEKLEIAINNSESWAGVCRYLNKKITGGTQCHLKKKAKEFEIDFSHFTGQAHRNGKTYERRPVEDYLKLDGPFINSHKLKNKLLKNKLKEHKCESCSRTEWNDKPIPIELDHINGDNVDNRIENLRILCPNCHAQTPTYSRRKTFYLK